MHKLCGTPQETFSNCEHHHTGVPVNATVLALNGQSEGYVDLGLAANPAVQDPSAAGRFKTPALHNVAVTGPYVHNGVFKALGTVILFYNKYNGRASRRQIDPEIGAPWAASEVAENLSTKDLETGPALDDRRIDTLVAFLKTLTAATSISCPGTDLARPGGHRDAAKRSRSPAHKCSAPLAPEAGSDRLGAAAPG